MKAKETGVFIKATDVLKYTGDITHKMYATGTMETESAETDYTTGLTKWLSI